VASDVFFTRADLEEGEEAISAKAAGLFDAGGFAGCFKARDYTAVKVHVGEAVNNTYIRPGCIKSLVEKLLSLETKPFFTDTSTLYTGRRHNAIDHAVLAAEHGFDAAGTGIPFIAPDGLFGTCETAVEINGPLNKQVFIASDIARCQSMLCIAHFTGHMASCAAASLKSLGMGCASRKGKMRQHSSLKPGIKKTCTRCGECLDHCPAGAITLDDVKARIDRDKCIGCAECVAVCRFGAVKYDWGIENRILQQQIAEHALGVVKTKPGRIAFYNFLVSVTDECDCFDRKDMPKIVKDIGILAGRDPVALDKASIDLVERVGGKGISELIGKKGLDPSFQIEHAERIGLGSGKYNLIEI
jgi:uncharacterized Fe-S center protein